MTAWPANFKDEKELNHTKAPAQEDPDPAAQAKQCSPVTIRRERKSGTLKDRI
jgi:hypothetical protein